ncbi:MAG TPA: DUF4411 family protein [Acetobacteraceae bacterium]|nr:DUF4411 family protein [Acetobacteraceae bacterium]
MSYVFDNSPLSVLFKNFYRRTFRSLWERFDDLVANGNIVSTREALREIEDGAPDDLLEWAKRNSKLFATPTAAEGAFVARIYGVRHFQQNIEQQKLLKGGKNADPFVIAKAAVEGRAVVTMEQLKPNATKIPNICQHFGIKCLTLEEFMDEQGWEF